MADRLVFDNLGRQAALDKIEAKEITRYCECFSQDGNQCIHKKNEALPGKLEQLKNRFKTLWTVRDVSRIVLTSDEDMRDLQAKIRTLPSEIDAARMRKNARVAIIEKQLHQLRELSMRMPDPTNPFVAICRADSGAS
jgi:hypothetical protein